MSMELEWIGYFVLMFVYADHLNKYWHITTSQGVPAAGGSQDGASHAWIPDSRHVHMVSCSPDLLGSGAASLGVSRGGGWDLWDWACPERTHCLHWAVNGIWEGRDLGLGIFFKRFIFIIFLF